MEKDNFAWTFSCKKLKVNCFLYLVGESLDKNGDKKVEEDVVPEGHQSDKVKSSLDNITVCPLH